MQNGFETTKENTEKNNIIAYELRRLDPKTPANQIDLFCEDLENIPLKSISECFKLARRKNTRFKFPTSGQVLDAWDGLKRSFSPKDWDPSRGQENANLRKRLYYTIESLPWCYISNRHRHLIRKNRAGTITGDEWIEYQEVKKLKWFRRDLRLNEDVADAVRDLDDPEEIVNISDYNVEFQKILSNV